MTREQIHAFSLALGIGAAGSGIFAVAGLPMPWLLGAMATTTVAALAGVRLQLPAAFRNLMLAVLGVVLGSGYTLQTFDRVGEWLVTLAGIATYVVIVGSASFFVLQRLGGYDRTTSFFAGMPGGINEMVIVGSAMGGDGRTIALVHAIRILLTVAVIVAWFRLLDGYEASAVSTSNRLGDVAGIDLAMLAVSGVAGIFVGKLLRLPAPFLFGPMLVSAAVHLMGWTSASPPVEISSLAQVVLGSALGCRFSGVPARAVLGTSWAGAGVTLLLLAAAALAALGLAQLTGLPASAILLAFAPAGIAEMTLIAFGLGIDVAFIAVHHLWRVMLVLAGAPLLFRLIAHVPVAKTLASPDDRRDK